MKRAMTLLQNFSHVCRLHQVTTTLAVGTAALRNTNSLEFVKTVQEETGIIIKIISGETEAKLGYRIGAINTLDVTDAVLFDLGGGSIELT